MSSIKLSPNASGTGIFTIAAPNSNTDRTLTLPDASGTFLTNSGTEAGAFSTLSVNSNNISAVNSLGFRNRIINGDCRIDQRNAGASITFNDAVFVVDRFGSACSQSSKATAQRSTTAPAGFTNSVLITSSSAYSVTATDFFNLYQNIEGFNAADLGWGTANAQSVTLSFWVRSSLTGTFGGSLSNSGLSRSYPFTYTISAANTFEYKTITIAGDTTGTWLTDNGIGIRVYFGLGVGSTYSGTAGAWAGSRFQSATGATSVVGTNGATFYITGVQLEAGSVATPFERRDYGRELMMCQRYYEKSYDIGTVPGTSTGNGALCSTMYVGNTVTGAIGSHIIYKQTKRAAPTISTWDTSGNAGKGTRDNFGTSSQTNITATAQNIGDSSAQVYVDAGNAASGLRLHWVASIEL